jgi:flavin-dependent thymidylate synthase
MHTINDIKVTLLNADEVKNFIKNHGEVACVCYNTNEKYAEKVGLSCMKDGHLSGSRGDYFKFEIEAPRFTIDQICRHEAGVFKNVQSQRYVDMDDNFSIYVPPKVANDERLLEQYIQYEEMCKARYKVNRACFEDLGITGETANDLMRTLLPIGVMSKIRIGFTLEALIHFTHKRLCTRADLPIRKVAKLMRREVLEAQPLYEDLLVAQCQSLMYCPEGNSCGKYPSREKVESMLQEFINKKDL